MDAFETVRRSFMARLGPQDSAFLQQATSPESVLAEVRGLEERHRTESKSRNLMKKIDPFIRGIEQYGKAFDVIANAKPEVLGPLWGGARIVLHLLREFIDIFEKLVEMLRQLGKQLGMFEIYARLYPTSDRLKQGLVEAYSAFLNFCLETRNIFNENRTKKSLWISSGSMKLGLKSLWKPVKVQFGATIDKLERLTEDVDKEADLAEKEEASLARSKAEAQFQYEQHRDLFEWLNPVDPSTNYHTALSLHEPGTGEWILQTPEFKRWLSASSSAIWLHAKPGAGKTVMSSTVITYLTTLFAQSETIVAYYYCDYKDPEKQRARKVFETLLAEMSRQNAAVLSLMEVFSKRYREFKSSCSLEILRQTFLKCLGLSKRTVIIIDALDECADRRHLLEELQCIIHATPELNLFLTSREEFDIKQCLSNLPQLSLRTSDMSHDIKCYVEKQVNDLILSKKLKVRTPSLREEIENTLSSKADGMFQWVKCQLDALCRPITEKSIRTALEHVPKGLDETYIRVLEQIRLEFHDELPMIKRLFFWLVHSLRPLKASELAEAMVFEIGQKCMDLSAVPTVPEDLLQYCGGLVTSSDSSGTIGLAHFSIKEFLLSHRIKESSVSEFFADLESVKFDIINTCISYLAMDDFGSGECFTRKQLFSRLNIYHLLKYAAFYWMEHYRTMGVSSSRSLNARIFEFLTTDEMRGNVRAWQQVEKRERDTKALSSSSHLLPGEEEEEDFSRDLLRAPLVSPVYYAAYYGLWPLTEMLIQSGYDINAPGGSFGYPVLAAAFGGVSDWGYISKLVKAGADIHAKSWMGSLAFANAKKARPQDWDLLKDLAQAGVDLNVIGGPWNEACTVLQAISQHPSDAADLVKFLLQFGANVNEPDAFPIQEPVSHPYQLIGKGNGPPLQLSCMHGTLKVAQVLLEHGAKINFAHCEYGSPLQAAVRGNQAQIVQYLLKNGADVDVRGGVLGTPLQAAAWTGNKTFVEMFMDMNAAVNADGGCFGSALTAAVAGQHGEIVEFLLHRDADPNFSAASYSELWLFDLKMPADFPKLPFNSPLDWAIHHRNLQMATRLIEAGAEINTPKNPCQNTSHFVSEYHPLCVAVLENAKPAIDFLISKGAKVATGDHCAILRAASINDFELFRYLLDMAAADFDPTIIVQEAFRESKNEAFTNDLISLVAEKSIQIPAETCTALLVGAVEANDIGKVRFLLQAGANPNVQDQSREGAYNGYIPLPIAIKKGHKKLTQMLLERGADVNVSDCHIGTPLFAACKKRNVALVDRLLLLGARTNEDLWVNLTSPRDALIWECGGCPKILHHAVAADSLEITIMLLDHGADVNSRCDKCPTALWSALKTENTELIRFLIKKGACVNEPDTYGRTALYRARQLRLDDRVCALLSELGAHAELPPNTINATIEENVKWLCYELSSRPAAAKWREWLSFPRWIMLGRCLYLGNDPLNAVIALEQSCARESSRGIKHSIGIIRTEVPCSVCFSHKNVTLHLCKNSEGTGIICSLCIGAHEWELSDAGLLAQHEYLNYPRPFFLNIPDGFVAISEDRFMRRDDWLGEIARTWSVN